MTTADNPYPANVIWVAFRYSTLANATYQGANLSADGGWVGFAQESNAAPFGNNKQQTTSTIASIAASTEYTLTMTCSISSVSFQVNGGTAQTVTTHLTASTPLRAFLGVSTNNAAVKTLSVRRVYWETN
jgi:hypothetical protein